MSALWQVLANKVISLPLRKIGVVMVISLIWPAVCQGSFVISTSPGRARTPAAPGNVLPTEAQQRRQDSYFRQLDVDKDGFVSKAEFMTQAEKNFARCDLDKDGRITTAECRQALQRRRPAEPASINR